jgi:hypothetical protein
MDVRESTITIIHFLQNFPFISYSASDREKVFQLEKKIVLFLAETPFHGRCAVFIQSNTIRRLPPRFGFPHPAEECYSLQKSINRHSYFCDQDRTRDFQKAWPMRYKSFLTQYVSLDRSIFQTSFISFLFSVSQVGLPSIPYTSQTFYRIFCSLEMVKVNEMDERNKNRRSIKWTSSFFCYISVKVKLSLC